jgi:hypothetical protein
MLLHIRPRFLAPHPTRKVELLELHFDPLGIYLTKTDLASRKPYPNRNYTVGCPRKGGTRAIDGLLIETATLVDRFTATALWAIDGSFESTHVIHYSILDHDFDFASDNMTLWYAHAPWLNCPAWSDRRPDWWVRHTPTLYSDSYMEYTPHKSLMETTDSFDDQGRILVRDQAFPMPTIERGRLFQPPSSFYVPPIESIFRPSLSPR